MVFAAGFGTRMRALTAERPKPLIEVAGRPLIDHALALAEGRGLRNIVVNAHYRAAQIVAHLSGRNGVTVLVEAPEILDTGGGLRNALPLLGAGPVFTLNSDAVFTGPNPLGTLADAWQPGRMDALLLLVPVARAVGRNAPGDFGADSRGRLHRRGDFVYTGAQIIDPACLHEEDGHVFSLNRVWDRAITSGRLCGVVHPGAWADVGHPEGIALAERMLADCGNV